MLPAVFEEIARAGYTPHELVYGLAQYSYRWDCTNEITGQLETLANDIDELEKAREAALAESADNDAA